ncbi:MAG: 4-hydroxybenzoate octaprenyltransferase [Gammaproteobacteria bacterium]|nr:4-hydroxybenzoate octaprenyltransferase [Gammaproteobacteria bacterium]
MSTSRLKEYSLLMRLNRPIGIYLVLWPTLWGLWLASAGQPDPLVTIVFVLGVVLMRSAGCVINDYADRDFDPHVTRTRDRPLAAGRVTTTEVLGLFISLCLAAFLLVLLMNRLTILMSVVAVLLAAGYPFMKRYTHLPQVFLGLAFGWAVPMSFAAQTGEFPPPVAWLLLTAVVLWAIAYDTMYAMVDREDDLRIGVKSTAILFADGDRPIIAGIQATMMLILVLVGQQLKMNQFYYLGLAMAAGLALYQQYLIRNRDPHLCFKAFLNNNWLGAVVFGGIFFDFISRT